MLLGLQFILIFSLSCYLLSVSARTTSGLDGFPVVVIQEKSSLKNCPLKTVAAVLVHLPSNWLEKDYEALTGSHRYYTHSSVFLCHSSFTTSWWSRSIMLPVWWLYSWLAGVLYEEPKVGVHSLKFNGIFASPGVNVPLLGNQNVYNHRHQSGRDGKCRFSK